MQTCRQSIHTTQCSLVDSRVTAHIDFTADKQILGKSASLLYFTHYSGTGSSLAHKQTSTFAIRLIPPVNVHQPSICSTSKVSVSLSSLNYIPRTLNPILFYSQFKATSLEWEEMHGLVFTGGTRVAQDGLYSLLHWQSIAVCVGYLCPRVVTPWFFPHLK